MPIVASFLIILLSQFSIAEEIPYGFTPEQEQEMTLANEQTAFFEQNSIARSNRIRTILDTTQGRPFSELETAGYLIFSDGFQFDSKAAKLGMAKDLPTDVTLVIYTSSSDTTQAKNLRDQFAEHLPENRIKIVFIPGSRSFWARDAVPVPVFRTRSQTPLDEIFSVVDAPYYHYFEPDEDFQSIFNAELTSHDYYYEGGNFIANSRGQCLIVNKRPTARIPDSIFKDHYGCVDLIRLPHVKGIGHADESVRFATDDTVMTDEPSYVSTLEQAGFQVIEVPRPRNTYETYVNSLLINGVIFVPVFNQPGDEDALEVYRDAGFEKVVGLPSSTLSNRGMGSVHCITMTYPPVEMNDLLVEMGGHLILE